MQEHIEWMQEKLRILVEYKDLSAGTEVDECIQHAEAMLEKEKKTICKAWEDGGKNEWACSGVLTKPSQYYKKTFNTKEK